MSLSDKCTMQYYYPTEELKKKYKVNCSNKFFLDIENTQMFNNEAFLKFVEERYGDSVFNGDSPFTFKDDYINEFNQRGEQLKKIQLEQQRLKDLELGHFWNREEIKDLYS